MITQRFENPEKQRYYCVILSQDLLGDWVVTKIWGGINSASGRIMHVPCATYDAAIKLIQDIYKIRQQRGYKLLLGECLIATPQN